jgi:hypothetical protein
MMSVGMRWPVGDGDLVTDFGVVEYPCPRPDLGEVGSLMLAAASWVDAMRRDGPIVFSLSFGGTARVVEQDGRTFVHYDYEDRHWVWEMFDAHWEPDSPHQSGQPMMIGRWPD